MSLPQISLIRTGLVMSVAGHLVFLMFAFAHPQRQTAHGETVSVELVPSNEVPPSVMEAPASESQPAQPDAQAVPPLPPQMSSPQPKPQQQAALQQQPKSEPPKSEPQRQQQQSQQPQSQQQQAAQPPRPTTEQTRWRPPQQQSAEWPTAQEQEQPREPPPVETLAEAQERLTTMLAIQMPADGTGAEAREKAALTRAEIDAFMSQLRRCWALPPGIAASENVKVVMRISLKPDGSLQGEPSLIEAAASTHGPPLVQAAVRALKGCAPYNALPAAKYKEWRVLDLNFSPDIMSRS